MVRLIAAVLVGLLLPVPASGTLVVIVPSADGLVVAADSRITIMGANCDDQFKITRLKQPARTIVAVTGNVAFVAPPGTGQPLSCASFQSATRLLDIADVVARYLEHRSGSPAGISLEDLSAACLTAVQRFQKSHPEALEPYLGKEIFSVVIANYDPRSSTSTILNFVVRIDPATREIRADRLTRSTISPQTRRGIWSFGETDYLNQNVFGGFGRKYLCQPTLDFILENKPVTEASQIEAVAAAVNVIQATSRAAELVPAPSGIGGPIHVVLLCQKRRPQEIPWPANRLCRESDHNASR